MASHISRANSKAVLLRQCQDTKLGNATLASLQLGCKCGQGARWFVLMPDYGQQPVIAVWPRSLERFKAKVASCTQLDRAEPVFQVPQLQLPGPLFFCLSPILKAILRALGAVCDRRWPWGDSLLIRRVRRALLACWCEFWFRALKCVRLSNKQQYSLPR